MSGKLHYNLYLQKTSFLVIPVWASWSECMSAYLMCYRVGVLAYLQARRNLLEKSLVLLKIVSCQLVCMWCGSRLNTEAITGRHAKPNQFPFSLHLITDGRLMVGRCAHLRLHISIAFHIDFLFLFEMRQCPIMFFLSHLCPVHCLYFSFLLWHKMECSHGCIYLLLHYAALFILIFYFIFIYIIINS